MHLMLACRGKGSKSIVTSGLVIPKGRGYGIKGGVT